MSVRVYVWKTTLSLDYIIFTKTDMFFSLCPNVAPFSSLFRWINHDDFGVRLQIASTRCFLMTHFSYRHNLTISLTRTVFVPLNLETYPLINFLSSLFHIFRFVQFQTDKIVLDITRQIDCQPNTNEYVPKRDWYIRDISSNQSNSCTTLRIPMNIWTSESKLVKWRCLPDLVQNLRGIWLGQTEHSKLGGAAG